MLEEHREDCMAINGTQAYANFKVAKMIMNEKDKKK